MNADKHVALTLADRCAIATACLPRDEYRAKLEALHREMLAAINPQESKMQRMNRLHAEYEAARDSYDAEYDLAVAALAEAMKEHP